MEITHFKAINKGHMVSSFNVYFPELQMSIRNLTLFQKDGKHWISWPSKEYEGNDGKKKYWQYVGFSDTPSKEAMENKIIQQALVYSKNDQQMFDKFNSEAEVPF